MLTCVIYALHSILRVKFLKNWDVICDPKQMVQSKFYVLCLFDIAPFIRLRKRKSYWDRFLSICTSSIHVANWSDENKEIRFSTGFGFTLRYPVKNHSLLILNLLLCDPIPVLRLPRPPPNNPPVPRPPTQHSCCLQKASAQCIVSDDFVVANQ